MSRSFLKFAALLIAVLVATSGCSALKGPRADELATTLASALSSKDIHSVAMNSDSGIAQEELAEIVAGMGDISPTVTAGKITYTGDTAQGEFSWSWPLKPTPFTYTSSVPFSLNAEKKWVVRWEPKIVHPSLSDRSRLQVTRNVPQRAPIIGRNGVPIVDLKDVVRIGIDKTKVTDAVQQDASARAVAKLVGIDEEPYAKAVKNAGAKAFVVAIINRGKAPGELFDIPGAYAQSDTMLLPPYRGFGSTIIGTVGEATDEIIAKSDGMIQRGDLVGLSGLQAWHDEKLRGKAGYQVELVKRENAVAGTSAEVLPATIATVDSVPGTALETTIDVDLQTKIEQILANETVKKAITVVQPSTGAILAMAQSKNANEAGDPVANWGHYPPGSTFKVITSLALVRAGLTAESAVNCPTSATVDGRSISNYPGYPAERNGTIALKDALAFSCNTVFVGNADRLDDTALAKAAGSLGVGIDYDAGFQSFFGDVPGAKNKVGKAEQTFGQGTVLASPMAITGMSASVAAKRTVVPWLVQPGPLKPTGEPLTEAEGAQLQTMMQQVVSIGSAKPLQGILLGAKTGTAEFGPSDNIQTHIWMTGYTANDLAITAFGDTGQYGTDLAPLIKAVLS